VAFVFTPNYCFQKNQFNNSSLYNKSSYRTTIHIQLPDLQKGVKKQFEKHIKEHAEDHPLFYHRTFKTSSAYLHF
jgi:hypothetical protein